VSKSGFKLKPAPEGTMPDFRMTPQPGGAFHFRIVGDMSAFARSLIAFVGRPIYDRTDLKGVYEINLDVTRDRPGQADTPGLPNQGAEFVDAVEQVGLRLESRKEPMEIIVVDHAERTPTEN
jgi:uncharacterized protein (TIGR03435 family)